MRPRLATRNGVLVAPVYAGPRFVSRAGKLTDFANQHAVITLDDACEGVGLLQAEASGERIARLAALYDMWADQLFAALCECRQQRRELGWADPRDADSQPGAVA